MQAKSPKLRGRVLLVTGHSPLITSALPTCWAVGDKLRMFTPEGFRDVTRPTHGLVSREDLRQFLRRDIGPSHGLGVRGE